MSRSGYSDDYDDAGSLNLYRANVDRTLAGKRGQAFLAEMAAALDAMPAKTLAAGVLVENGESCAMGAVALRRGIDTAGVDEYDPDEVAALFGISEMMAREISYINDESSGYGETPEQRWKRVREWIAENTRKVTP